MTKPRGVEAILALPGVHLKNGQPYVRISYHDGSKWRSKEKRVRELDEALRVLQELKAEYGLLGPAAFDGERMTFADLLKQYQRAHPNKPKWYLVPLAEYFGQRRIRQITYGDLRRFKDARAAVPKRKQRANAPDEPRNPATINRELETLRAVLLYALGHGWLKINPFKAGPPLIIKGEEESRERVPTPEEEARLLAMCVPPHRAHVRPLIIATRDTGLRKSALQSLVWRNADFAQRLLWVPKGSRYKRRPKAIGMTARLHDELQLLWKESEQNPDGKIFGEVKDFGRAYDTACKLAGIAGLRFNDFRHGFSTDLMEAGVPQHLAMKAAGHIHPETHDIYTNLDERLALQVAAALDRLHAARQSGGNSWADGQAWPLASDVPQ